MERALCEMQVEVAEGERGFLVTGSTCQEALRGGPRPKAGQVFGFAAQG